MSHPGARTDGETWLGENFVDALLIGERRADVFDRG